MALLPQPATVWKLKTTSPKFSTPYPNKLRPFIISSAAKNISLLVWVDSSKHKHKLKLLWNRLKICPPLHPLRLFPWPPLIAYFHTSYTTNLAVIPGHSSCNPWAVLLFTFAPVLPQWCCGWWIGCRTLHIEDGYRQLFYGDWLYPLSPYYPCVVKWPWHQTFVAKVETECWAVIPNHVTFLWQVTHVTHVTTLFSHVADGNIQR